MIHRIIREVLAGKLTPERDDALREIVREASIQSSERERIAQDAERECDQLKMVEYMMSHIGESFDGMISGVTQFGLFVQLNNGVEGLIHVSYLSDDYYVFSEKQMALIGERTRRVFRMGDPVRVRVAGASKDTLTIDFELEKHYREGTMEWELDGGTIVYDEDLSPKERKAQIAMRKERAKRERRKGGDFHRSGGEGRPSRQAGSGFGRSNDGFRRSGGGSGTGQSGRNGRGDKDDRGGRSNWDSRAGRAGGKSRRTETWAAEDRRPDESGRGQEWGRGRDRSHDGRSGDSSFGSRRSERNDRTRFGENQKRSEQSDEQGTTVRSWGGRENESRTGRRENNGRGRNGEERSRNDRSRYGQSRDERNGDGREIEDGGNDRGYERDRNRERGHDRSASHSAADRGHGMEPFWMSAPRSASHKKKHKNPGFAKGGMKAGGKRHSKG